MVSLRSLFQQKPAKQLPTSKPESGQHQNYEVATSSPRSKNLPIKATLDFFKYGTPYPGMSDGIYRPLDSHAPFVEPRYSFAEMRDVYETDPEVSFGIDWLAAVSVGVGYHFTVAKEYSNLADYVSDFAYDINLDEIALIAGRESLGYGNSVWTYKDVSEKQKSFDTVEPLPLTALKRIWWKSSSLNAPIDHYEFRGADFVNLLPSEIIHFRWRIVNAHPFGFGLIAPIIARPTYTFNRNGEDETRRRMSLYDIKASMLDTGHKIMKRYVPRNVYNAKAASSQQLNNMQAILDALEDEQDIVLSGDNVITELGKGTRAIDLEGFEQLYRNEIIKAIATPISRLYEKGALTEASSKVAKEVALMHMYSFQRQMQRSIELLLIKPWYMANPKHDANGVVIPWKLAKIQLHWGQAEKPSIQPEQFIQMLSAVPQAFVVEEIRKYASNGGVELTSVDVAELENRRWPNSPQLFPTQSGQNKPGPSIAEVSDALNKLSEKIDPKMEIAKRIGVSETHGIEFTEHADGSAYLWDGKISRQVRESREMQMQRLKTKLERERLEREEYLKKASSEDN